jgi:predicted kinase
MIQPDEHYFSRENDVYAEFCKQIHDAFDCPWVEEVWADATHLTEKARNKLLTEAKISTLYIDVIPVVIKPSLETTLAQNAQRTGRENVPERVITNMYNSFEDPWDDNIEYEKVIYVEEE